MSDLIERDKVLDQLHLNHKDVIYIDKNECAKRIMAIPSARLTNRGICGVCAGRKVCGKNNRNLDMLECSIFELDEHYKISRPKGEWMPIIEANEFGEAYQAGIYCSECGEILGCEANFCPNCGCAMTKENE